jgi:hypothetical protein
LILKGGLWELIPALDRVKTPKDILELMEQIAYWFGEEGETLRSGHSVGADMAFERGCAQSQGKAEIYLPWNHFNESHPVESKGAIFSYPSIGAYEVAARFHPRWNALSYGAKTLHARNAHQVLGYDLRISF